MGPWSCRVPWWACPEQQPKQGSQLGRDRIAQTRDLGSGPLPRLTVEPAPSVLSSYYWFAVAEIGFGFRYPEVQIPDLLLPECKPQVILLIFPVSQISRRSGTT